MGNRGGLNNVNLASLQRALNKEETQLEIKRLIEAQVADLAAIEVSVASIDTKLTATNSKLDTLNAKDFSTASKQDAQSVLFGAVNETAPVSDTASSGLNGRLQRISQRLTTAISSLTSMDTWLADIDGYVSATMDVAASTRASEATLALVKAKTDNLDVALSTLAKSSEMTTLNAKDFATQTTLLTIKTATEAIQGNNFNQFGSLTESAPGTDTASSGLNGRLQRIAQHLTTLLSKIPAALGQTTMAGSLSVAIASDQSAISVSEASYKTAIDEASASVTYVGRAVAGTATSAASWQVSKFTLTGAVLVQETADGDFLFNNIWDNRASLTYS
jgi:hypothetical protein